MCKSSNSLYSAILQWRSGYCSSQATLSPTKKPYHLAWIIIRPERQFLWPWTSKMRGYSLENLRLKLDVHILRSSSRSEPVVSRRSLSAPVNVVFVMFSSSQRKAGKTIARPPPQWAQFVIWHVLKLGLAVFLIQFIENICWQARRLAGRIYGKI